MPPYTMSDHFVIQDTYPPLENENEGLARRHKRRKYIAVACDECRRRKLKCLPGSNQACCQRCASRGFETCNYEADRRRAPELRRKGKSSRVDTSSKRHETVSALSQDLQTLRETLKDWMTTANPASIKERERQEQQPEPVPPVDFSPPAVSARAIDVGTVGADSPLSASTPNATTTLRLSTPRSIRNGPEEPRFIGPTRPAYSLEVGARALSRLGIPAVELPAVSEQQSPQESSQERSASSDGLFWERCDRVEFTRMLTVFQEEVESVYPCVDTMRLAPYATEILELWRLPECEIQEVVEKRHLHTTLKDIHLAQVAIAITVVIEGNGKSESSALLVAPVERSALSILKTSRELIDLQLLILLSIYYFHSDEDLLAWRTIGLAARESLVMGLHRKTTLMDTFTRDEDRNLAVRVFWAIYVLDRRWSFGTSLSFALVDRDIDPELELPGEDCAYLNCMVGYGRLCSVLWDALVPFGHENHDIPESRLIDLDLKTQEWLESIPLNLRLRHPRLGLASLPQPPVLQRLRALLYLRGNHSRILIYRYFLLGPNRIKSSYRNAWLAIEIAQDSIQVLVHLNESSDIYRRQQAAFNYFLLSALAVLFLAVCNDPETFAAPCKKSLHSAIDLLSYFSHHSWGSRRLWRSVRGIIPRLRRLEMRKADRRLREDNALAQDSAAQGMEASTSAGRGTSSRQSPSAGLAGDGASRGIGTPHAATNFRESALDNATDSSRVTDASSDVALDQASYGKTTPDFSNLGNELTRLFQSFENGQYFLPEADVMEYWNGDTYIPNFLSEDQREISWQLNGLIQ